MERKSGKVYVGDDAAAAETEAETFSLSVSLHFSHTHNLTHAPTQNLQCHSITTNHGHAVIIGCNQQDVSVMNIA